MKKKSFIALLIPIIIVALTFGAIFLAVATEGAAIAKSFTIIVLIGAFVDPFITLICSIIGLILSLIGKKRGEKTAGTLVLGIIELILSITYLMMLYYFIFVLAPRV